MLADAAKVGTFYLEAGIREFAEWSHLMVKRLGEEIRPHLEELWAKLKPGPIWYSKAERLAMEKLPGNASGDSILATLRNAGVKPEEMEWLGLEEKLAGKQKVYKGDVMVMIRENGIKLQEKVLGDTEIPELKWRQREPDIWRANPEGYEDRFEIVQDARDRWHLYDLIEHHDIGTFPSMERARFRAQEENRSLGRIPGAENTQYESWVLPGEKSNYREMLLTLPDVGTKQVWRLSYKDGSGRLGAPYNSFEEAREAIRDLDDGEKRIEAIEEERPRTFTSPHFSGHNTNLLAHVRFDDRMTVDGKRTLFVEEVQSDWHQKGKREGYAGPESKAKIAELEKVKKNTKEQYDQSIKKIIELLRDDPANPASDIDRLSTKTAWDWLSTAKEVHREYISEHVNAPLNTPARDPRFKSRVEETFARQNNLGRAIDEAEKLDRLHNNASTQIDNLRRSTVPDAPFKSDWHELVIKRMIRKAAEDGYDSLSWVTGDQTAERYDLSKRISRIDWFPTGDGIHGRLVAYDPDADQVVDKTIPESELPNYIGKEPAKKLIESGPQRAFGSYLTKQEVVDVVGAWQDEQSRQGSLRYPPDAMEEVRRDPLLYIRRAELATLADENGWTMSEVEEAISHGDDKGKYNTMHSISGLDLKVGGEWAKNLYDKALVNFVNKFGKRFGAKVIDGKIKVGESPLEVYYDGPQLTLEQVQKMLNDPDTTHANHYYLADVELNMRRGIPFQDAMNAIGIKDLADKLAHDLGGKFVRSSQPQTEGVHTLPITPEMRKSVVQEGVPIAKNEPGQSVVSQLESIAV